MHYILFFLLLSLSLFSAEIVVDKSERVNITPDVSYYLDQHSEHNIDSIRTERFHDSNVSKLMFGYEYDATLWIKFTLNNPTDQPIVKFFEYDYPIIETFSLTNLKTNETFLGGYAQVEEYNKVTLNDPIALELPPHSSQEFLLKSNSSELGLIAKLILWQGDAYQSHEMFRQHIMMLFFGAMAGLFLYNLFLFYLTRDSAYFFYSFSMLTFTMLELFLSGYFMLVDTPIPEMQKEYTYILLYAIAISFTMFTDTFLRLKIVLPKLHRLMMIMVLFLTVITLLSLFGLLPTIMERVFLLIGFIIVFGSVLYSYTKVTRAKYYLLGWLLLLISSQLVGLNQLGFAAWLDNVPYINKITIFSEALLFSMALSARIRSLQKEKAQVAQELYEQKIREGIHLEKRVQERTEELQEALQDKELLFQEIHHRVKNNLQIIISLLRLQSDEIEDVQLQKILVESENRVRAISSVHEMLYQNDSLRQIDTQTYFQGLCNDIQSVYASEYDVEVLIHAKPFLPMDTAIYCGLILNELVTNAYKYAFSEKKGTLHVSLYQEKEYIFTVTDDGKGLDVHTKENLGMMLVKTLVSKQLKGTMKIDTTNGTAFSVRFGKKS